jgi:hypothetical protein
MIKNGLSQIDRIDLNKAERIVDGEATFSCESRDLFRADLNVEDDHVVEAAEP